MDGKKLLWEGILLLAYFGVERLFGLLIRRPKRWFNWLWTLLLLLIAAWNLGPYWFAYPLAGWMIIGLALVFLQLIARKEFLYHRFWPAFWRLSVVYALIVAVGSIFLMNLPIP